MPAFFKTLPVLIFLLLGVTLQIQITLFSGEVYNGLRVNLTDIFLPFIGLFILLSLCLRRTNFPNFAVKHIYHWLIALSAIFFISLANTYFSYGSVNQWGLVNKLIGWFVLVSYFLMGAWLIQNIDRKLFNTFLKIALYFFMIITVFSLAGSILLHYGISYPSLNSKIPLEGLMGNKNSYIFWALFLLFATTLFIRKIFPVKVVYWFWFLLPLIFLFTGARAGYISFALMLPMLFLFLGFKESMKPFLYFILGIVPLVIIANTAIIDIKILDKSQTQFIHGAKNLANFQSDENKEDIVKHRGDSIRLNMIYFAKDMIVNRPFIGSGLGSHIFEQQKEWGFYLNIIDSTPLWLAAEFGVIGLGTFLVFYFILLKYFWKNGRSNTDPLHQKLCQSVFIMMVLFAIMSLFHELFYTRFLWFFMGLGLAYPVLTKSDKSVSKETL